jgi:ABC-2 type transport system permease protein
MGIVTPLVMAGLIGLAFGGGITFSARIALVDLDGSALSKGITDGLVSGTPADAPLSYARFTDADEARRQLSAGSVDAVLIVPASFGASVSSIATGAEPPALEVVIDANKRIAGDVTTSIANGISARIRSSVLAISTALAAGPQPPDAATIQRIVAAGQQVTVPVALDQVDVSGRYSMVAYFGAAMGVLFLFFTVGAGARSLITERKEGTLQRVRAAPISDSSVLLGKSIGVLSIGLASMLTIWLVTSVVFRAPWGNPVAVLGVIVAIVFAVAGISTLVTGLARTDAQADGYTAVVAFALALLGGSFQQPGSLPGVFQKLALLTPNGWALRAFTQIGAGGANLRGVLPSIAVLVTIGAVTTLIGIRGLQAKVTQ